jgi:hypothetical protein
MPEYIWVVGVLVVAVVWILIKKLRENSMRKKLHHIVSWCASEDAGLYRGNLNLWQYVSNAQLALKIPKEFRLNTDEEWLVVKNILREFQKVVMQEYLKEETTIPTSKYVIDEKTYFFYWLMEYLEKHQCDTSFIGYDMHKEVIEYKQYGSWGGQLFDAKYALSDFALAFHKLYYIACLHCKTSKALNPKGEILYNDESIKEILISKEISISRF